MKIDKDQYGTYRCMLRQHLLKKLIQTKKSYGMIFVKKIEINDMYIYKNTLTKYNFRFRERNIEIIIFFTIQCLQSANDTKLGSCQRNISSIQNKGPLVSDIGDPFTFDVLHRVCLLCLFLLRTSIRMILQILLCDWRVLKCKY